MNVTDETIWHKKKSQLLSVCISVTDEPDVNAKNLVQRLSNHISSVKRERVAQKSGVVSDVLRGTQVK